MNLSLLVFDASSIVVVVFAIAVMGLLVFYALRSKGDGDVRAEISHGSTMFKLEVKGRPASKVKPRKRL
jgi:hypothetical protein